MSAGGWMSLRRFVSGALTRELRLPTGAKSRRTIPSVESLEGIMLLSTGGALARSHAPRHHEQSTQHVSPVSSSSSDMGGAVVRSHEPRHHELSRKHVSPVGSSSSEMDATSTPVTLPAQTLTLGASLTNFTNVPLSPALNLFDPSLGTLISVEVSHSATIVGNITSQNLSTSSSTVITGSLSGSYSIDGLNQTFSQPTLTVFTQPTTAGPIGSGTSTVTFPPITLPDSASATFTDPTSLAFYTASSGRATITPTMTATANASADAPDGNLFTVANSTAASTVTVTYTYLPACPTLAGVQRIGVHHQRTLLIVTYTGVVNPTRAEDTANYTVITAGGKQIPIVSATFDPATNSVTLEPAIRLNVHLKFTLSVVLPCSDGDSDNTASISFGGKSSLIGFHDHQGKFVPVKGGRIEKF